MKASDPLPLRIITHNIRKEMDVGCKSFCDVGGGQRFFPHDRQGVSDLNGVLNLE
jgi:hypothetical protein